MTDDADFLPLESSPEDESEPQQAGGAPHPAPRVPVPGDDEGSDDEPLLPRSLLELMPHLPGERPARREPPRPAEVESPAPAAAPPAEASADKVLAELFPEAFDKDREPVSPAPPRESLDDVLDDLFPDARAASAPPPAPEIKLEPETRTSVPAEAVEKMFEQAPPVPAPAPEPPTAPDPEPEPAPAPELEPEPEFDPQFAAEPPKAKGFFGRMFGKLASAFGMGPKGPAEESPFEPITQDASAASDAVRDDSEPPMPESGQEPEQASQPDEERSAEVPGIEPDTRAAELPAPEPLREYAPIPEPALEPNTGALDTPVVCPRVESGAPDTGRLAPVEAAASSVLPAPAENAAPAASSAPKASRETERLAEWCRALEARIEVLAREKDALVAENQRLRQRESELVAIIKGIEQAFVIGRLRRGQPLPGTGPVPPAPAPGDGGDADVSEQEITQVDLKPLKQDH